MNEKKILIVGAGITGSTLAALLERRGIVATVVDVAHASDPNGYGITIMPRGLQVLETLGIRKSMEQVGTVLEGCKIYNENEQELNSFALSSADIDSITLSRGNLLDIVRGELIETIIQWQTSVEQISHVEEGVSVTLTNGSRDVYDLVIGADGIDSLVRSKIFPDAQPEKVGAGVWMLSLPENCAVTERRYGRLVFGVRRFMAVFPYDTTAAVAFSMPLDTRADPADVDCASAFSGMSSIGDEVLAAIDKSKLYCGQLRQVKLDNWYQGRVVLAGDAAHAMLPATGMGASNGIQGAAVLSRLIGDTPIEEFDTLPTQYQKIHKPTIDAKRRQAFAMGHVMITGRFYAAVRNTLFRLTPSSLLGKVLVRK